MKTRFHVLIPAISLLFSSLQLESVSAFDPSYENAPIFYSETKPNTPLTRLFDRIASGEKLLTGENDKELVHRFLDLMKVPSESQVLVFSKTSQQNSRISPDTPRAIYFSDNAYIGWVQGGHFEVATLDPRLGVVFHLVHLIERKEGESPTITREASCLDCHAGSSNRNFPGLMVRSVFPGATGQPIFHAGTYHTRQDSPIEHRWGGWYVTGEVENHKNMGNSLARETDDNTREVSLDPMSDEPVKDLKKFFNPNPYLNGGKSDVVALMILEHQVGVHNALIQANLITQQTLHRQREMQKAFGESEDAPLTETNERIIENLADGVLKEMLFAKELNLPEEGIEGSLEFQKAFQANRKKDSEGRSLKDLRLYERLFKYRCSYLIYSDAFTFLPEEFKAVFFKKLHGILTDAAANPDYAYLGSAERKRIHEILAETLPGLPDYW